jgi:hypothetical protein
MERLSETQYWFVVVAGLLTPMLTFWIIDIVGWVLRRTLGVTRKCHLRWDPSRPATNRPALPLRQAEADRFR